MIHAAKMDTVYFDDSVAEEGFPCEVRLGDGEIVVSYEGDDGFINYTGKEIGEGHFQLSCASNGGSASLHCFKGSKILEGFWIEDGVKGFWRICF